MKRPPFIYVPQLRTGKISIFMASVHVLALAALFLLDTPAHSQIK
jgi:hypothetical protein